MKTTNVDGRKSRLVRAFQAAARTGDTARSAAIRKAFWRLMDATMQHHHPKAA
jgi:hypothetical protein